MLIKISEISFDATYSSKLYSILYTEEYFFLLWYFETRFHQQKMSVKCNKKTFRSLFEANVAIYFYVTTLLQNLVLGMK